MQALWTVVEPEQGYKPRRVAPQLSRSRATWQILREGGTDSDEDRQVLQNEQPFPSYLYDEPPWPMVVKDPSVVHTVIHQCMTGQVGPYGNLVKKPTGFVANHRLLLSGLFKFI